MGRTVQGTAADGHSFGIYRADPIGAPRGALVIVQEIFGVNSHIRAVCDDYAAQGYVAVAPALFDRVEAGMSSAISRTTSRPGGGRSARRCRWIRRLPTWRPRPEVAGGGTHRRRRLLLGWDGGVGCGDPLAYFRRGGQLLRRRCRTLPMRSRVARCCSTSASRTAIPLEGVEELKTAHPELPVHIYPAGHGFNCDQRASYHAESARLARERTLAFLREHVGWIRRPPGCDWTTRWQLP